MKSYANSTIPPYRQSSTFHLSSQTEGMSCIQLAESFTLNENSEINSAIYLHSLWPGSWVEVYVFDKNTGDRQVVLSVESNGNYWRFLTGRINRKFENAQVAIYEQKNDKLVSLQLVGMRNFNDNLSMDHVARSSF